MFPLGIESSFPSLNKMKTSNDMDIEFLSCDGLLGNELFKKENHKEKLFCNRPTQKVNSFAFPLVPTHAFLVNILNFSFDAYIINLYLFHRPIDSFHPGSMISCSTAATLSTTMLRPLLRKRTTNAT